MAEASSSKAKLTGTGRIKHADGSTTEFKLDGSTDLTEEQLKEKLEKANDSNTRNSRS